MKRILACLMLLCIGLLCACTEQLPSATAPYEVCCRNTSDGRVSIRYTGEENGTDKITLPNGERTRSFSVRYVFEAGTQKEERAAVMPAEPVVIYVELPDRTVLTCELAVPYGEGEGARFEVEFNGTDFDIKIKYN